MWNQQKYTRGQQNKTNKTKTQNGTCGATEKMCGGNRNKTKHTRKQPGTKQNKTKQPKQKCAETTDTKYIQHNITQNTCGSNRQTCMQKQHATKQTKPCRNNNKQQQLNKTKCAE